MAVPINRKPGTVASTKKSRKKKKEKRTDASYLTSAKNLSAIVPRLRKYRRRKSLTRYEKSAITRREKQLKNIPFLVPVTKAQAKRLKGKLFFPGIQAIQLRNVQPGSKIKFNKRGDIEVVAGDQHWIYWSLDRDTVRSRRGMRKAGEAAFSKQFPIEKVSALTELAFKKYHVQQVHLWAHAGIVGDSFEDLGAFIRWVNEKWNAGRYMGVQERLSGLHSNPSDPGKWVNGIAILIENPEYTKRRLALEKEAQKNSRVV